jgi:hypothetical protein
LYRPQQFGIKVRRRLSGIVPQQIDQLFHQFFPRKLSAFFSRIPGIKSSVMVD